MTVSNEAHLVRRQDVSLERAQELSTCFQSLARDGAGIGCTICLKLGHFSKYELSIFRSVRDNRPRSNGMTVYDSFLDFDQAIC